MALAPPRAGGGGHVDDFETTPPRPDAPEPRRRPWQEEMPFAVVDGEPVVDLPRDLYIPPDALEVILEAFEGPLDLLLYLVKRQNLDILDIPIATITRQYMEYIDLMKELRLELAAEYLAMAAMLAEIKSRLLLPQPETIDDEDDPRAELVRRLQEYERYKQAAAQLDELPRIGRDLIEIRAATPYVRIERPQPRIELDDLLAAIAGVLARAQTYRHHQVRMEWLSVRERMSIVLERVQQTHFVEFTTLFTPQEGRQGVVVTLLALLELLRESLIDLVQARPFGPLHVRAAGDEAASDGAAPE
jgi:segregation and condensation protein A